MLIPIKFESSFSRVTEPDVMVMPLSNESQLVAFKLLMKTRLVKPCKAMQTFNSLGPPFRPEKFRLIVRIISQGNTFNGGTFRVKQCINIIRSLIVWL